MRRASCLFVLLLSTLAQSPARGDEPLRRPPGLVRDMGRQAGAIIPPGRKLDAFEGDPALDNNRIIARLGKDSSIELRSVVGGAPARLRFRLLSGSGEPAVALQRVALVENTRSSAAIEAVVKTAKGEELTGRVRLKLGDVYVQVEPGPGAGKLRLECPGRYVVLPDFFADDITLDATKLPLAAVDLPSENFVLHPTADADAIGMCVFETRQQDVKVSLSGNGNERHVAASEVAFEGKKVWVAMLESPEASRAPQGEERKLHGIWHTAALKAADAGSIIPLAWKPPYPAQWRVDFTRSDDLTDSWEMLLQDRPDGEFIKPSWLGAGEQRLGADRSRWNTVLGRYPYPCWIDAAGQGYVQPLKHEKLSLQGPLVIYPINRVKETPLHAFTVVDIMRNTLGVGPCEHILDLEGQKSEYRGRATCSVRDTLVPIYARRQQRAQITLVNQTLDEGLIFVKHIRGRIARYIEFGQKLRQYLAEQKKARPELAAFINEMDNLTQEIDNRVAARVDKIKTPEHVAQMNEAFRRNVLGYTGPDALVRCKEYAGALVEIGDNQDELSGECRWAVKTLRQRAGIMMALDPRVAPIALEIRSRTQEVMRNPASHEAARH